MYMLDAGAVHWHVQSFLRLQFHSTSWEPQNALLLLAVTLCGLQSKAATALYTVLRLSVYQHCAETAPITNSQEPMFVTGNMEKCKKRVEYTLLEKHQKSF